MCINSLAVQSAQNTESFLLPHQTILFLHSRQLQGNFVPETPWQPTPPAAGPQSTPNTTQLGRSAAAAADADNVDDDDDGGGAVVGLTAFTR